MMLIRQLDRFRTSAFEGIGKEALIGCAINLILHPRSSTMLPERALDLLRDKARGDWNVVGETLKPGNLRTIRFRPFD